MELFTLPLLRPVIAEISSSETPADLRQSSFLVLSEKLSKVLFRIAEASSSSRPAAGEVPEAVSSAF